MSPASHSRNQKGNPLAFFEATNQVHPPETAILNWTTGENGDPLTIISLTKVTEAATGFWGSSDKKRRSSGTEVAEEVSSTPGCGKVPFLTTDQTVAFRSSGTVAVMWFIRHIVCVAVGSPVVLFRF